MENKKNRVTGESTFKFPLLGNKKNHSFQILTISAN